MISSRDKFLAYFWLYPVAFLKICILPILILGRIRMILLQGAFYGLMYGLIVGLIRMVLDFSFEEPTCMGEDTRPFIVKKVFLVFLHKKL